MVQWFHLFEITESSKQCCKGVLCIQVDFLCFVYSHSQNTHLFSLCVYIMYDSVYYSNCKQLFPSQKRGCVIII